VNVEGSSDYNRNRRNRTYILIQPMELSPHCLVELFFTPVIPFFRAWSQVFFQILSDHILSPFIPVLNDPFLILFLTLSQDFVIKKLSSILTFHHSNKFWPWDSKGKYFWRNTGSGRIQSNIPNTAQGRFWTGVHSKDNKR